MLDETVRDALNEQIRCELDSAYRYLAISAWFEAESLPGCAHWMDVQAREEVKHAMRLYRFVLDRGAHVELRAIQAPPQGCESPLAAFEAALEHERFISSRIHALHALAGRQADVATQSHLQWFVDEQVEEEKSAGELVALFRRAGRDEAAMLTLDARLAARTQDG